MPGGHVGPDAALRQGHMALTHERAVREADVCALEAGVAIAPHLDAVCAVMHHAAVHNELAADSRDAAQASAHALHVTV